MSSKSKCKECGICCMETEMLLSKQDINLIREKVFSDLEESSFFFKNKDGLFQLKNVNKKCFFFNAESKECEIYKYRPKGCKFYPLIFDLKNRICFLDDYCPRKTLFFISKQEYKKKCQKLKKYVLEELLSIKKSIL